MGIPTLAKCGSTLGHLLMRITETASPAIREGKSTQNRTGPTDDGAPVSRVENYVFPNRVVTSGSGQCAGDQKSGARTSDRWLRIVSLTLALPVENPSIALY
jgi:hypothetical protein